MLFLAALLLLVPGSAGGGTATVLLASHPERLVVYNRYQQTATAEERARLRPLEPMVVVADEVALPDGFTHCMQVRVRGDAFFLMKDGTGALAGGDIGLQVLRNADVLDDTMKVAGNGTTMAALGGGTRSLPRGTPVRRLLSHGGRYLLELYQQPGIIGWTRGHSFAPLPNATITRLGNAAIADRVRTVLARSNAAIRQLHAFFWRETGRDVKLPVWTLRQERGALVCVRDAPSGGSRDPRSARYLAKDIENTLLGTGCHVELGPGRISVLLP